MNQRDEVLALVDELARMPGEFRVYGFLRPDAAPPPGTVEASIPVSLTILRTDGASGASSLGLTTGAGAGFAAGAGFGGVGQGSGAGL